MILALKTDSSDVYIGLIDSDGNVIHEENWSANRELAKYLLKHIADLLKKSDTTWSDIKGLIVFKGPGSFTGLRIGITVANTLAYANQVSIVGQDNEAWMQNGLQRLASGHDDRVVMPEYGAEAHITTQKK